MKKTIIIEQLDGTKKEFNSWTKALKHYDLFTSRMNAEKSTARLESQGFFVEVIEGDETPLTVTETVTVSETETKSETKSETAQIAESAKVHSNGNGNGKSDLFKGFAHEIEKYININASIDPDEIKETIKAEVEKALKSHKKTLEIKLPDGQTKDIGRQHKRFETLLQVSYLKTKAPLLVGPAGSFKTTAAEKVAEARDLDFFPMSVGAQTTKSDLLGYMDAHGNYVRTIFRNAFENGGVFLLDEMDAGNANVLTILNNALSGSSCSFPDGIIKKHPDFVCIAAANTFGTGADRMYVGRNQLDEATRNRFLPIIWGYDEDLEREICGNDEWFNIIIKYRRKVEAAKERIIISPRETFAGVELLALGMPIETVEQLVIFEDLKPEQAAKLKA